MTRSPSGPFPGCGAAAAHRGFGWTRLLSRCHLKPSHSAGSGPRRFRPLCQGLWLSVPQAEDIAAAQRMLTTDSNPTVSSGASRTGPDCNGKSSAFVPTFPFYLEGQVRYLFGLSGQEVDVAGVGSSEWVVG